MRKVLVLMMFFASTANLIAQTISGMNNGHDYVDLGLPSGTLWATTNVGANDSKENGDYFAWAETSKKNLYSWFNYKYSNEPANSFTKYCTEEEFGAEGYYDNLKKLQTGDDVAAVNWGSTWRMPSREQWVELQQYCTWIWDLKGYKVVGPNGNNMYLPAAGYHAYYIDEEIWAEVDDFEDVGSKGYYWSSSLEIASPERAFYFNFNNETHVVNSIDRAFGCTVRPVLK